MPRSPAELNRIREVHRRALGLSGVPDVGGFLGNALAGASVRMTTAFPATDETLTLGSQGETTSQQSSGSAAGGWFVRHVLRPKEEIAVGGTTFTIDRYRDEKDYSTLFRVGAWALGIGGTLFGAWTLARAFVPAARGRR